MKLINPDNFNDCLTNIQIQSWREKGYLILNNIIEPKLLNNAKNIVDKILPSIDNHHKLEQKAALQDFGSNELLEFPCKHDELNQITLSPNIIKSVQTLLNYNDIRLAQSDTWIKYGGSKSIDINSLLK